MKMAKKFLGLMIIAVAAMFAVACDASTCAAPVDCGLVGEWKVVDGDSTIKFEADGKFTSSVELVFGLKKDTTYYAKQVDAGYVILCDEKGNIINSVRYFFFDSKLNFGGVAYERKN